jgi:hypothetical protein
MKLCGTFVDSVVRVRSVENTGNLQETSPHFNPPPKKAGIFSGKNQAKYSKTGIFRPKAGSGTISVVGLVSRV